MRTDVLVGGWITAAAAITTTCAATTIDFPLPGIPTELPCGTVPIQGDVSVDVYTCWFLPIVDAF